MQKTACFGEGAMELCTREKAVFFLPVNILMVWCADFLGHTTHLDSKISQINTFQN